jgi:hypothetical protein
MKLLDPSGEPALAEEVAYTAQVTSPSSPTVATKTSGSERSDAGGGEHLDQTDQRGEAGGIVADAGSAEPASHLANPNIGAGREDGVEMGRHDDC